MSKTSKYNDKYPKDRVRKSRGKPQRRISARVVRRDEPDLRRMSRALVAFALAEAAAEADAETQRHEGATDGR